MNSRQVDWLWDLVLFVYYQCSKILKLVNIALFWRPLLAYGSLNIHIFSSFQSPNFTLVPMRRTSLLDRMTAI